MAERKIFAGPRLRRIRNELGLTQSRMAAELGVSASYLNLIERDHRPLTVPLVVKLAAVYDINLAALDGEADQAALDQLKAIFSDPLLESELPSTSELHEVVNAAPNVARAIVRLHGGYQETLDRLTAIAHLLESRGGGAAEALPGFPQDEAAARLESAGPWFEELEAAAERLSERLKPRYDPALALTTHLKEECGVEVAVLPIHVMPDERARFDRHSMRLFLSEQVALAERPFFLARQLALLLESELLDRLAAQVSGPSPHLLRSCRRALARRFADALLIPAKRFADAGQNLGFALERLADRFASSPIRIMFRWAAVAASGRFAVPPASVVVVDGFGTLMDRILTAGFQIPDKMPVCGRLPLFDGMEAGRIAAALIEPGDGARFVALAAAQSGLPPQDGGPPRRVAAMLAMPESHAEQTVYATIAKAVPRLTGVSCRVCDRPACPHRTKPPLMHASAVQDHSVDLSEWL